MVFPTPPKTHDHITKSLFITVILIQYTMSDSKKKKKFASHTKRQKYNLKRQSKHQNQI